MSGNTLFSILIALFVVLCSITSFSTVTGANDQIVQENNAEAQEAYETAPLSSVHDEQILFRGAEWGANMNDVLALMPQNVTFKPAADLSRWYSIDSMMFDFSESTEAKVGCYRSADPSSLSDIKVAGYPLKAINLYFVYTINEDGSLLKDSDHTAFCFGDYQINASDAGAAFEDLTIKLSSLYGEVGLQRNDGDYRKMNLWYGQDGTMVSVYLEKFYNGNSLLYVKYGTKESDEYAQAAIMALEDAARIDASDVDGL